MKQKIFVLLLAVLMLLGCSACGEDPQQMPIEETHPSWEAVVSGSQDLLLFENDACRFYLKQVTTDAAGDYAWQVLAENRSGQSLILSMDEVYVNEVFVDPYWAVLLSAGQQAEETVSWYNKDLALCNIEKVDRVDFRLTAYPPDDQQMLLADVELTVYPNGTENYQPSPLWGSGSTVLLEDESCAVAVTRAALQTGADGAEEYRFGLCLRSLLPSHTHYTVDRVKINGQGSRQSWQHTLAQGKAAFCALEWDEEELAQMEITQVLHIELQLSIVDASSGQILARHTLSYEP